MEKLLLVLGVIMMVLIMAILLTLPVMWLWNWLMPLIFGLIKITFWQAFGLDMLCGFLFKTSIPSSSNK